MKTFIKQIGKKSAVGLVLIGATTLCFSFIPTSVVKTTNYPGGQEKWVAPADADKKTNPIASDEKSIAKGKTLFTNTCLNCHGKKGKGDGPKSAELDKPVGDLTKDDFQKQSDGALFWKITEGRKPMPGFKKDMTEEQRWQVINYVRTLGSGEAKKK